MRTSPGERIIFRDYPIAVWLTGLMFVGAVIAPSGTISRVVFTLIGAAIIALAPVLIVSVDQGRRTLALKYRSLLRVSTHTYQFDDILAIDVPKDGEDPWLSRIELILQSGQRVPLRIHVSIGRRGKERNAQLLRDALSAIPPARR